MFISLGLFVGTILSQTVGNGQDINLGPDPNYKCPNDSGIFPHPTICDQFYNCWVNVTPSLWQCGKWENSNSPLAFNLDYNGCDFIENVDCEDRIPPGQGKSTINCSAVNLISSFIISSVCMSFEQWPVPDYIHILRQ